LVDDSLRDLYQDVILEHNRRPRNYRVIQGADRELEGFNPLCGDRLTLYLKLEGDRVADAAFQGHGCAISTSSASLMTEAIKGKPVADAKALFERFVHLVRKEPPIPGKEELGKLAVFSGVWEFPARVKCATLAWHTLNALLEGKQEKVTTE
jgi:nitrogen fixation protein NifU and related proteins